jgi:hypothetical protein
MELKIEKFLRLVTGLLLPPDTVCVEETVLGTDESGIVGYMFQIGEVNLDVALTNNRDEWTFTLDTIKGGRKILMVTVLYQHAWYSMSIRAKDVETTRKFRDASSIPWDEVGKEIGKALSDI